MTQVGKAVINQQEGTEAGASGDDLGAPFSLPTLSKSALTYHQQVGGGMARSHRAPSGEGGSVISFPLPVYTEDANGGLCIGRNCADHRGLGAFGRQQAAQGIYLCIACHSYQYLYNEG